MNDLISRQSAINAIENTDVELTAKEWDKLTGAIMSVPSEEPKEVKPRRNYKYLSDFWCECGWHLGRAGSVKYCPDCGKKVNWNEWIWNKRLNQQTGGD